MIKYDFIKNNNMKFFILILVVALSISGIEQASGTIFIKKVLCDHDSILCPSGNVTIAYPIGASGTTTINFANCNDSDLRIYQASNQTWICSAPPSGSGASLTRIGGSSGAAGSDITWQTLTSDASAITSTTPTVVMTTTGVGAGTYHFKYLVIYQSAATSTGIGIGVNHSGTTGTFVMDWMHITTGGAAATGVGDQVASTNAGQLAEGKSERVKNTVSSASAGVDTANSNMLAIVDGVVVVTVSGDLQLKVSSEVAGSGITVKAATSLELNKIA